jgi:ligand-binding sensor domain-containing protein
MKKLIILSILVFLAGCGMTTKDTVTESSAKSSTIIYAITDKGLSISESNGNRWDKAIQKGRTNQIISSVFTDCLVYSNKLILATNAGLSVPTGNGDVYDNYLEDKAIRELTLGNNNTLYVATDRGIYTTTGNYTFTRITPEADYRKAIPVDSTVYVVGTHAISIPSNNAWIAVLSFPTENIIDAAILGTTIYTLTNQGLYQGKEKLITLLAEKYTALYIDPLRKTIWVGTDKGLQKSGDNGNSWIIFEKIDEQQSLNEISSIMVDNINIYLGTSYGLVHSVNGGETWKVYRKQHGLVSGKIEKVLIRK